MDGARRGVLSKEEIEGLVKSWKLKIPEKTKEGVSSSFLLIDADRKGGFKFQRFPDKFDTIEKITCEGLTCEMCGVKSFETIHIKLVGPFETSIGYLLKCKICGGKIAVEEIL